MKLHFRHVPRAMNAVADWLTNVARMLEGSANMTAALEHTHALGKPPWPATLAANPPPTNESLAAIQPHAFPEPDLEGGAQGHPVGPTCLSCGQETTDNLACWGCGKGVHA